MTPMSNVRTYTDLEKMKGEDFVRGRAWIGATRDESSPDDFIWRQTHTRVEKNYGLWCRDPEEPNNYKGAENAAVIVIGKYRKCKGRSPYIDGDVCNRICFNDRHSGIHRALVCQKGN